MHPKSVLAARATPISVVPQFRNVTAQATGASVENVRLVNHEDAESR
jgi:TRAP-type uncharacterized transport system substrate-binding protein